ncbi:MAG: hypothetical protein KA129_10880 [Microthrixaceae bacterium]|nr:hypothetical protein [Microthrixaceae bacterium]
MRTGRAAHGTVDAASLGVRAEHEVLFDETSPRGRSGRARLREAFAASGVAVVERFASDALVESSVAIADSDPSIGHFAESWSTPYLAAPRADVGREDGDAPRAPGLRSALTAIAADRIPAGSPLMRLYESAHMRSLVAAIVGVDEVFDYADPLGRLNLAVMGVGDELAWHFDMTDFVVSVGIRPAGGGGDFDVVRDLRGSPDEVERIAAVCAGSWDGWRRLPIEPGTLMVFAGRRSMHRVAPITVGPERVVALLAYDARPGTDSTDELKLVRYGRRR